MKRRGLALLALVAALGLALAGLTSGGAPAVRHTPTINALPVGSTCYVAGQTCSLHPCVEFIAARCEKYPGPLITPVPARPRP